jgi:hypothetical protein
MARSSGIDKAWERVSSLDPEEACLRAGVGYDQDEGCYVIASLGTRIRVCPEKREIGEMGPGEKKLPDIVSTYFDLAALCYLAGARETLPTGRHVRPSDLKGGHHFFTKGTHQLPLHELASRYGADRDLFLREAGLFGGRRLEFGDASVELLPFPRIPVYVILWLGDDEFEPRADLLFDSTAEMHGQVDFLWSVAMMSLSVLL